MLIDFSQIFLGLRFLQVLKNNVTINIKFDFHIIFINYLQVWVDSAALADLVDLEGWEGEDHNVEKTIFIP